MKAKSMENGNIIIFDLSYKLSMRQEEYRRAVRVQPFELITKIQEAKPTHLSTLVNKELGYDVLVEQQIVVSSSYDQSSSIGVQSLDKTKFGQQKSFPSSNANVLASTLFKSVNVNESAVVKQHQNTQHKSQTQVHQQKIKNCICSARPNSQTFKRLSKIMLTNLKNGVNQVVLFCSHPSERQYRIQSSIGTKSNPGVFLVSAISFLNEKYNNGKQISSFNYDIQISFSQMIDGHVYDLLNYTGEPLKVKKCENKDQSGDENGQKIKRNAQETFLHGETFIKVSSFKQFIKLYKIALFNNKQRDFKTSKNSNAASNTKEHQTHVKQMPQGCLNKASSTFFMKIRSIVYDKQGELCYKQETIFIDFQNTQPKSSTLNNQKAKKVKTAVNSSANKTIWDYILVDLNNANGQNKKLHYHLVEQNYLLQILKKHLQHGQVTFVASLSANPIKFKQNLNFVNTIRNYSGLSSITVPGSWQHKLYVTPFKRVTINWGYFQKQVKRILSEISKFNYTSIRELENLKAGCIKVLKKFNYWLKNYKFLLLKIAQTKRISKVLQNSNIADQITLIGSCVKSDHFKDFYNAKSHISLQRQVEIKTEYIKKQIKKQIEKYQKLLQSFSQVKEKQQISAKNWRKLLKSAQSQKQKTLTGSALSIGLNVTFNQLRTSQNFGSKNNSQQVKTCSSDFILQLFDLSQDMLLFFQQMQGQITQHDQRTIADQIIREQIFLEDLQKINSFWIDFYKSLKNIGSIANPISCEQQKIIINGSHFSLLKEIKMKRTKTRISQLGVSIYSKQGENQNFVQKLGMSSQNGFFGYQSNNAQNCVGLAKRRFLRLPQIKEIDSNIHKNAQNRLKYTNRACQSNILKHSNVIQLNSFKISSLLINPNELLTTKQYNNQDQSKTNVGQRTSNLKRVESMIQ